MAWFTSWIPSLPNINITIPATIQGRFLSFILKKCLGHFLKPGQLDHYHIDSQIGSGYVQVNQVELDPQAINSYLDGLPISMTDGHISAVRARIPWPNPLATTVGMSLTSIQFTFQVIPPENHTPKPDADIAQSVASVADSFIQEELSPRDEATLWQSFHEQDASSSNDYESQPIPGTLGTSTTPEGASATLDHDPAGVSIFASLIENILARFEFDARDIKITLVHPDNMSVTFLLQEMRYQTDARSSSNTFDTVAGESRTLSFSGLSLSTTQLDARNLPLIPIQETHCSEIGTPRAPSRASSESFDEETQLGMTQSLAALPPRSDSPANSVASSLYQSALSVAPPIGEVSNQEHISYPLSPHTPPLRHTVPIEQSKEETLLSLGSRPITVKITTPSPDARSEDNPLLSPGHTQASHSEELYISISMGTIACAIKPWQLSGLHRLSRALSTQDSPTTSQLSSPDMSKLPPLRVTLFSRGLVLLLDPIPSSAVAPTMTDFFEKPLVPPRLDHGYSRIQFDTLEGSTTVCTTSQEETLVSTTCINFTLADLSLLYFSPEVHFEGSQEVRAFPLLITDRHISSQYPHQHEQPDNGNKHPILPTFHFTNWTDEKLRSAGSKLSHWRSRSTKSETVSPSPALRLQAVKSFGNKLAQACIVDELNIDVIPLHVRLDMDVLVQPGCLLSFFDGLLPFETNVDDKQSIYSDATVDDSPDTWRRNIEEDLESPFGEPVSNLPVAMEEVIQKEEQSKIRVTLGITVVRISFRCPSPPEYPQRSGIVVADIHDICVTTGSTPAKRSPGFENQGHSPIYHGDISDDSVQLKIQFRRAVLASVVDEKSTTAFASIGSLKDIENEEHRELESQFTPLQPRIQIVKPDASPSKTASIMAVSIDIPAIYVDVSKSLVDALQYFADDIAQSLDRMSSGVKNVNEAEKNNQDTSLIGSRFFAKSRSGSLSSSVTETAETVVKMTLTEAFVRIRLPRRDDDVEYRPFDVKGSDVDVLLEINPSGKQQTVLTLGVMDLAVLNTTKDATKQTFLSLTSPHSLTTIPKSIVKLRFLTSTEIHTKETRVKLTMCGFTYTFFPDLNWISDLLEFGKNPPGTFESVIPSDRTRVSVKVVDGSMRLFAPDHPGGLVAHVQELDFSTDVVGDCHGSSFNVNASSLSLLASDDCKRQEANETNRSLRGVAAWTASGYALVIEVPDLYTIVVNYSNRLPEWKVDVHRISLRLHMCSDTMTAVGSLMSAFGTLGKSVDDSPEFPNRGSSVLSSSQPVESNIMSSVDDLTFKRMPEIGPAPDMIDDDLPTNMDYLDDSFGPAAGLRELRDDDLDEFDNEETIAAQSSDDPSVISKVGGETIKILDPQGLDIIEDYFLNIPTETTSHRSDLGDSKVSLRIFEGNFNIFLYDGYDWARTRKTIEEGVKEMRKKLAKIRQLVANGHVEDSSLDETSTFLFNSIHIGLDDDDSALGEPAALIAAIDRELKDDDVETTSWQSLPAFNPSRQPRAAPVRVHGKRLTRSKGPSMEFSLQGLRAEFDKFYDDDPLVSRTFVTVRDVEILDHIKTSTWKKFLTQLRSDSRGNVRETDSDMVRVELRGVRPVPGNSAEEARMKARILPLRLYVDQDAVDFLKKFFSFNDPAASSIATSDSQEAYIQHAEIFPVDLKLDYKPRRVDYQALKQGRSIELMNFFHFDGAEMTLRHITLAGITGWGRLFEMLNDLWTPDVKATQLAEVISGVAPIRSIVNVGSGVADLILLPISQYKKDGRIVRGVQKGAKAFVKSTAIEAIKMGANLATGTQVILEQAEGILGGNFEVPITAEPLQSFPADDFVFENDEVDEEASDLRSKYAQQPADIKEGVQSAYRSLRKNLSSAAQTILAVPMEVYERSGSEGPVRSVIRAVPIAVLKPMIGASEAVSKTLQGLHNTLDPNVRQENEAKYKR